MQEDSSGQNPTPETTPRKKPRSSVEGRTFRESLPENPIVVGGSPPSWTPKFLILSYTAPGMRPVVWDNLSSFLDCILSTANDTEQDDGHTVSVWGICDKAKSILLELMRDTESFAIQSLSGNANVKKIASEVNPLGSRIGAFSEILRNDDSKYRFIPNIFIRANQQKFRYVKKPRLPVEKRESLLLNLVNRFCCLTNGSACVQKIADPMSDSPRPENGRVLIGIDIMNGDVILLPWRTRPTVLETYLGWKRPAPRS